MKSPREKKPEKLTRSHSKLGSVHILELKMAEEKFLQRRESRYLRGGRNQKAVSSNILEAIAQLSGGNAAADGQPTRMKIVVKKEDLKQVLAAIRDSRGSVGRGSASTPAATSLEQRLNLMRRRQILRAASQGKGRSRLGSWMPVLQSIPEELLL